MYTSWCVLRFSVPDTLEIRVVCMEIIDPVDVILVNFT